MATDTPAGFPPPDEPSPDHFTPSRTEPDFDVTGLAGEMPADIGPDTEPLSAIVRAREGVTHSASDGGASSPGEAGGESALTVDGDSVVARAPATEVVPVVPHVPVESSGSDGLLGDWLVADVSDDLPAAVAAEPTPALPADDDALGGTPLQPQTVGSGWFDIGDDPAPPPAEDSADITASPVGLPDLPGAVDGGASSIFTDVSADGSSRFDRPADRTAIGSDAGSADVLRLDDPDLGGDLAPTMDDELFPDPTAPQPGDDLFAADSLLTDEGSEYGLLFDRAAVEHTLPLAGESDGGKADFLANDQHPSDLGLYFQGSAEQTLPLAGDELASPSVGGVDFNYTDNSSSGSNLFADVPLGDPAFAGASGVNLGAPDRDSATAGYAGAESSIFGQDIGDLDELNADDVPPVGDADEPTELDMSFRSPPASDLFAGPTPADGLAELIQGDHPNYGRVSFDLPAGVGMTGEMSETSGLIDWSVPPTDDEVKRFQLGSTGTPGSLAEARSDAGLGELANLPIPAPVVPPAANPARASRPSLPELDLPRAAGSPSGVRPLSRPASPPAPAVQGPGSTTGLPTYRGRPVDPHGPMAEPSEVGGKRGSTPSVAFEPAAPKSRGGALVGGAIGLAAGVGACAAAYFAGVVPVSADAGSAKIALKTPLNPPAVAPPAGPTLDDAHALLAAGSPAAALKGFDAAGEDAPAGVKAARGQARWLSRVRELAAAGDAPKPADAELARAEADLTAAATDPTAGAQAALHLGLLKEVTGDVPGAVAVYTRAAGQFPDGRPVFEAALARLRVMYPTNAAPNPDRRPLDEGRLPARLADELARAAVVASLLLQADAPAAPAPTEPGVLYWKAANAAAAGDYDTALAAIADARKLHDKARLRHAGGGINPTSDPLGQIFLRTCDDLRDYWTLKRDLYSHPKAGELVKKDGVKKTLDGFVSATETAAAERKKLEEEKQKVELAARKLQDDLTKKDDLAKLLEEKNQTAAKNLADAKKALDDRTKELTDADAMLKAADAKLKIADATLTAVVKELQANGLLDEADPAKLPGVVKTVAVTAASADAKKAAQALLAAKKQLESAQADVKVAEADAEKARAAAKAAVDGLGKAVADARVEADKKLAEQAKKAADAAREMAAKVKAADDARAAEAAKRAQEVAAAQAQAQKELADQAADFERKLAARTAELEQRLSDARAGVAVPLTSGERAARDRAERAFGAGVTAFDAGRFAAAEELLVAATREDPNDARYWYYLGLARWAQGNPGDADVAFKKGAELEARNRPTATAVAVSLERVQGPARRALAAYRP